MEDAHLQSSFQQEEGRADQERRALDVHQL